MQLLSGLGLSHMVCRGSEFRLNWVPNWVGECFDMYSAARPLASSFLSS
jgi:hypothetical protein